MKQKWIPAIVMMGVVFMAGCQRQEQRQVSETTRTDSHSDTTVATSTDTISGTGLVVHLDLEGGFYGIIDDRGERLDLANIPEDFKVDSLRVRYQAAYVDRMTTHMWGRPADLITIERLD